MNTTLSTGIIGLDIALGSGGLPRGRLTEIFGPEKCGKTALCLSILSEAQKCGSETAWIDADQTLDPSRAARAGVDIQKLFYARPENAHQALDITRTLTHTGAFELVVLDSVAGLLTLGVESTPNSQGNTTSRVFSQAVRELAVIAKETGTTVILTNELRERAGVIYGVPVNTPGGIALKLHTAVRLELTPRELIRSGIETLGERVQAKVVKPKSSGTFHTIIINIMYNGVVSRLDNLFNLAVELNVINKRGGSYSYGEYILGRGREMVLSSLCKQPQLAEDIETDIRGKFLPSSAAPSQEDSQ
jgi:recombination protein RecA